MQLLLSSQNSVFLDLIIWTTLYVVYEHEKAINILKHQTPEDKVEKGKRLYEVWHPCCVRSITQSCSVYISIYTYSHELNSITIGSNI